jgi:hypothetical protein
MMTIRQSTETLRTTTLVVIVSLALLYLATLTADYYWDGITFALQIEKVAKVERSGFLLVHQNHLLYNVLGYVAYGIAQALSLTTRALYILQIANAVIGAAAVGVFFVWLSASAAVFMQQ